MINMASTSTEQVASDKHEQVDSNTATDKDASKRKSVCLIVLGMAGSGKTTFVDKLVTKLYEDETPAYSINLDPACRNLPYPANIDIRDTINYKRVMKDYELGPNGAIITSLNLFTTKFDQLISLIEQKTEIHKHFILDTPGQIEVFNWSASGMIVTETLASQMPTVIIYVMDTVRNKSPATFMSNMLYACSILYKTKLPLIVVMNKTDLQSEDFILDWMKDYETFAEVLETEQGYTSNLTRSLALALDSFYSELKTVGVSSLTGVGLNELLLAVDDARQEYLDVYLKDRLAMNQSTQQVAVRMSSLNLKEGAIMEEDEDFEDEA